MPCIGINHKQSNQATFGSKSIENGASEGENSNNFRQSQSVARSKISEEDLHGKIIVELFPKEDGDLGLIITGGFDKASPPRVAYLKPGGIAQVNDGLEVGDIITAIDGVETALLKHSDVIRLLQSSANSSVLELEYSLPEPQQMSFSVLCKRIGVVLKRDVNGTFGMTLRGGFRQEAGKSRPLTVTQIRHGGPADRDGILKVGDRILAINGVSMLDYTLSQALKFLQNPSYSEISIVVEYDVSVLEVVQNATGPLLVEIDKQPGYPLGIQLGEATYRNKPVLCINSVSPASVADRCGALHVGDHVLAIDKVSLENIPLSEATKLVSANFQNQIQLEVVPAFLVRGQTEYIADQVAPHTSASASYNTSSSSKPQSRMYTSPSLNSVSSQQSQGTCYSMTTQVGSADTSYGTLKDRAMKWDTLPKQMGGNVMLSCNQAQVCHVDTTEVMLVAAHHSFGLTIDSASSDRNRSNSQVLMDPPIIVNIEPKSPAERCGVLQEGDRVLAINGQYLESRTMNDVQEFIRDSGIKMLLLVEFNVAESIIPSSGVFVVKFAKRGSGLGITISCPKNRKPGQHLVISDIKKGSVAHRTGTIQPGDQLLAIDNVRLDSCTLEDSARVLQDTHDVVKLTIKKDENFADEPDPTHLITYTVELPKFAGPLGIIISGSEEPFEPIFISSLEDGGLAEKTGALHVGDRLLAINGVSLRGKTRSDAIHLLQNAGQTVTLKITRPANKPDSKVNSTGGKCHDSMDSALESWDSSGQEGNKASNGARTRDEHQCDGSSNSSNPSNNTTDSAIRSESNDKRSTTNVNKWTDGGTWDFMSANSPSGSMPPSCCSSGGVDEWSRRIDDLDHLRPLECDNGRDSFSDLPDITEITELVEDYHHEDIHSNAGFVTLKEIDAQHCTDIDDIGLNDADDSVSDITTADIHLKEVEEQLQNIFTPTPIELMKVTLLKSCDSDDFGFSVCDGVFEKGVYVGAIRRTGPAADVLKPFDRVLQVNLTPTKDLDCCQVVPLIGQSGNQVDLVISRNPLVWGQDESPPPYRVPLGYECRVQGPSVEKEAIRRRDTLPKQSNKTDVHKKSVASLHDGNRGIAR